MKRIKLDGVVKNFYYFKKDFKRFNWLLNGNGYTQEFRVLKGLNFEINDGEIVGILGANGAGKSTTLKIIAGIYTASTGNVEVNGKVTSLLELGAGFNPILTGRENIYFKGNVIGLSEQEIDNILDDVIEFADIGEYMDMPLNSYSSGMAARLGFALAVMVDPEILIIDEVFAVGDRDFQQKSRAKTMEFFEQGKTILFVSHSEDLIRSFCNRVIYLKDGFVQYDGEVEGGIAMYHEDIRKGSKTYGMVYEKCRTDNENIDFYFDLGRMYENKVFEPLDLDKIKIEAAKVSVEKRKYFEPGSIPVEVEKVSEYGIKVRVKLENILSKGYFGFQFEYKNHTFYAHTFRGDDTLIIDEKRMRIRHLSRKLVFDFTENF